MKSFILFSLALAFGTSTVCYGQWTAPTQSTARPKYVSSAGPVFSEWQRPTQAIPDGTVRVASYSRPVATVHPISTSQTPVTTTMRPVQSGTPLSYASRTAYPQQVAYAHPVSYSQVSYSQPSQPVMQVSGGQPMTVLQPIAQSPTTFAGSPAMIGETSCNVCQPCGEATFTPIAYQPTPVYRPVAQPVLNPKYRVGKGLLGQPKLYVRGQPVRNAFRFISF